MSRPSSSPTTIVAAEYSSGGDNLGFRVKPRCAKDDAENQHAAHQCRQPPRGARFGNHVSYCLPVVLSRIPVFPRAP